MAQDMKHNKWAARWAVVAASALASVGIWVAVTKSVQPSTAAPPDAITISSPAPTANPNFSNNDTFLTQVQVPTGPTAGRQPIAPAVPSVRPRLRTRGS